MKLLRVLFNALLISLLFNSCCKSTLMEKYEFDNKDIDLLHYKKDGILSFENEEGLIREVKVNFNEPFTTRDYACAECCEYDEYETIVCELSFEEDSFILKLRMVKYDRTIFEIYSEDFRYNGYSTELGLDCNRDMFLEIDSCRKGIFIGADKYENVLDFYNYSEFAPNVTRVLFSEENGVEFVMFRDSTFLRLKK